MNAAKSRKKHIKRVIHLKIQLKIGLLKCGEQTVLGLSRGVITQTVIHWVLTSDLGMTWVKWWSY